MAILPPLGVNLMALLNKLEMTVLIVYLSANIEISLLILFDNSKFFAEA